MIERSPSPNENIRLQGYHFLPAPRAGDRVIQGQPLVELADRWGQTAAILAAPESGYILWRVTHPIVAAGEAIVGLGSPPT